MNSSSPLTVLRQRWWIVAMVMVVGLLFGAIPSPDVVEDQATQYRARHIALANDVEAGVGLAANQVVLLATTGEVPARVARELSLGISASQLARQVEVEFDLDTGALTITTTQDTPEVAVDIADTFAEVLVDYLAERQDVAHQRRVASAANRLAQLEAELGVLSSEAAASDDDPVIVARRDAAARQYSAAYERSRQLSETPSFLDFATLQAAEATPRVDRGLSAPASRTTRGLMGLAVGLAVGVAAALVVGQLDRKIRTRAQAEDLVGMRARVLIPKERDANHGEVIVVKGRHDLLADSYRMLRSVVGFVQSGLEVTDRARVTVVVSPGAGDGKTSVAANLAAAFAESGQYTVALNTDFRRPRLGSVLGGSGVPLPFTLDEMDAVDPAALLVDTGISDLLLMDISEVEGTAGELIRAAQRSLPTISMVADSVVIDTSPVGVTAEVLEVIPYADVIVMVVRVGHTAIGATERTMAALRDLSTAPIVLALTGVPAERSPYLEYSSERTLRRPDPVDPPTERDATVSG